MKVQGIALMMRTTMAAKRFETRWALQEGRLPQLPPPINTFWVDIDIWTNLVLEQNATLTPAMSLPIIFKTLPVRGKTGRGGGGGLY